MNVLNITTILPYDKISENDVIYKNSNSIKEFEDVNFYYLRPIPYSNIILSYFSYKWKLYYNLPKEYVYKKSIFFGIKGIAFPRDKFKLFRSYSYIYINKKRIEKILIENKINVIHAHYIFPDGLIARYIYKKYKIPYILTVRNESRYFKNLVTKKIAEKICNDAFQITTVSVLHKKKLNLHVNKKVMVIPHWIKASELYEDYDINKKIKIVCVSNFIKRKNIDVILKALNMIDYHLYEFELIGDGEEYKSLVSIAKRYQININFRGRISYEEVMNSLKESDIFVLPSENETFGRVYIEAMAKSNLVIGLKETGLWETSNSAMVFLERPEAQKLAKILKYFIKNREKIRIYKIKGYKYVRNQFIDKVCVEMLTNLYKNASQKLTKLNNRTSHFLL